MSDCLQVQNLFHYVELLPTEKERKTASGLFLPDQWWPRQDSTALILQTGPGLPLDGGAVLKPMCEPGDLVLLEYGDFRQVEKARDDHGERGFVSEPNIIGWLVCDGDDSAKDRPIPLGEWCLIRLDKRPTMAGSIALSDKTERPMSGIVESVGPGRLITQRDNANRGRRLTVDDICGSDIGGRRVHWGREADVICAGRTRLQWVMLKASDLTVAEEPEHIDGVRNLQDSRYGCLIGAGPAA